MVHETRLGHRLLVSLIDEYALEEPCSVWASVPLDELNLSKGFVDITYENFANAINIAAIWLQNHLPLPTCEFQTIAYVDPKDVRYPIIAIAAAKLKRKLLLPSPFVSPVAHAHLIKVSDCEVYLHGGPLNPDVLQVLPSQSEIKFIEIPSVDSLLWQPSASTFPYDMTWDQAKNDPWLIFHTSGTTGMPKLIIYDHSMMSSLDAAELMPDALEEIMNRHFKRRR